MAKKVAEAKTIPVTRIDCCDGSIPGQKDGVKSRHRIFITPSYAREHLGLSADWVAQQERRE